VLVPVPVPMLVLVLVLVGKEYEEFKATLRVMAPPMLRRPAGRYGQIGARLRNGNR
jgi:hypothetical protein